MAGRTDLVEGIEDWQHQSMAAVRWRIPGRQDGQPYLPDRADRERTPFEELRAEIALAVQAFGEPPLRNLHEFRIAPDFEIAVGIPEFFAQQQAGHVEYYGLEPQLVGAFT